MVRAAALSTSARSNTATVTKLDLPLSNDAKLLRLSDGVPVHLRTRFPSRRNSTLASGAPEEVRHAHQHGAEREDEHRRQDEPDQREEDLRRGLLRALLGGLTPALAHVDREVSEHLADRDAERLALDQRLRERTKRRALDPG